MDRLLPLIALLLGLSLAPLGIALILRSFGTNERLTYTLTGLLTGWAVGRALHRRRSRFFVVRWLARAAAIPVVAIYVFILFFTQYTSFLGPASILEQHAFLLPVPFISL